MLVLGLIITHYLTGAPDQVILGAQLANPLSTCGTEILTLQMSSLPLLFLWMGWG